MNSFMCFGKHQRKVIQHEHPNLDNKAVSKILGQRWAALSPAGRETYQAEAQRLADEHKRLYPDWRFTRETKKKEKKAKAKEGRSRKSKPRTTTPANRAKAEPMEEDTPPSYNDALDMTPVEPSDVEQLSQLNQLYSEQPEPTAAYAMDYDSSMFFSRSTAFPTAQPDPPRITVSSHASIHNHVRQSSLPEESPRMRYVGSPLDSLSVQHSPFSGGRPPPYCYPPNFHDAMGMLLVGRELSY